MAIDFSVETIIGENPKLVKLEFFANQICYKKIYNANILTLIRRGLGSGERGALRPSGTLKAWNF